MNSIFTKLIINIIIINSLCISANGNTRKTFEQVSAANLQWAIMKYVESEKAEPKSWHDLETTESSKITIKKIIEITPKFKIKHKFINTQNKINFRAGHGLGGEFTIIAMGNNPRERIPTSTSIISERILILRNGEGHYSVGQYSEVRLARVFREAGFDLADFTGPNGKWQSEPADNSPKVGLEVLPDDDGIADKPEVDQRDGVKAAAEDSDVLSDANHLQLIVGILIGMPILAFLVWQSVAAIRKKRQG